MLGMLVPALLALQGPLVDLPAFIFSLMVAIITAVEGVFKFGIRWRMNRQLPQELEAEGWAFARGLGHYAAGPGSKVAFIAFCSRIEMILERYGDEYLQELAVPTRSAQSPPAAPTA
ncbi:hypothetical protein GCM10027569_71570 [Flindersiella endophytica]